MIFKRKIYDSLRKWKKENGASALLIEGARRIGKSTIAEEFARNEYESYILLDFSNTKKEIIDLFDDITDLDLFFAKLQFLTKVTLHKRKSLIIFDEVQFMPKARQAIKHLVADRRYDYLETGSLISIGMNVKGILIPSEEDSIKMYPMDYEEFLWAMGDTATSQLLRSQLRSGKPLGDSLNRNLMRDFRLYLIIGGMPQAIEAYLEHQNFEKVDQVKRRIISLYEKDFMRIDSGGALSAMFDNIPAQLSRNLSRYQPTPVIGKVEADKRQEMIAEMAASMTVNISWHVSDPAPSMAATANRNMYKMFVCDTGLFVTLTFKNREFTENVIYSKLLSDKLSDNLGYVYENVVAQMLTAQGFQLFYTTFDNKEKTNKYEIDFLIARGNKVIPIEVKSSGYLRHASLDAFMVKYSSKIGEAIMVSPKDMKRDGGVRAIPFYMIPFLSELEEAQE